MKRKSCVLLAVLSIGIGILAIRNLDRAHQEQQCINEAEKSIEKYFINTPHPTLGGFQGLDGKGYSNPVWNIQGYHYLVASRNARFAKGSIRMQIYVTEGRQTSPGLSGIGSPQINIADPGCIVVFIPHSKVKQ